MTWITFSILLMLYSLWNVITTSLTYRFLFAGKLLESCTDFPRTHIIIPLLREQKKVEYLVQFLDKLMSQYNGVNVAFVTTERELLEKGKSNYQESTYSLISERIKASHFYNRYIVYNFPTFNTVVAEQLNYAIENIKKSHGPDINFIFYNADVSFDISNFGNQLQNFQKDKVYQQSSLFTNNIRNILDHKRYFTACFGIYQSLWTIKHEIPRYILASNLFGILPKIIYKRLLNYCVTHGLHINNSILNEIDNFPVTKQGGEDIAIGYILRLNNYEILPLNNLENSESPETFKSLWKQLANWYIALLGTYLDMGNTMKGDPDRKRLLSFQGFMDVIFWLIKGPLIILYLIYSYEIGEIRLSLALYYATATIPFLYFLLIYKKLDRTLFPLPHTYELFIILLLFPWAVIIRSFPPFTGIFWFIKIKFGAKFIRLKTE